jgi:serine/threonine protein kinase
MVSEPYARDRSAGPSLARGDAIGRYMVLGLVGRGAMGEVYAAYDPELDRKVAVKLLRAAGGSGPDAADLKSRLLREAQAIARLSHPNVVVVHDVGSFRDQVFVAMEFVEGHTVSYWLHSADRTWRDILRVFVAAGRGLAAAHAAQMVHRDFKAENVMLTDSGQVRVMDFGLARHLSDPSAHRPAPPRAESTSRSTDEAGAPPPGPLEAGALPRSTPSVLDLNSTRELPFQRVVEIGGALEPAAPRSTPRAEGAGRADHLPSGEGARVTSNPTELTQTGMMVGTPAYMSPEQFRGRAADARSDQFSFCVALYEALYGERPFAGATVDKLSENVLGGRLRPPSVTSRVPGWVRRALFRGLAGEAEARWPSMEALLGALERNPRARGWWYLVAATAISSVVVASLLVGPPSGRRPTCQVPADRFTGVWEPPGQGPRRKAIAESMRSGGGKSTARESFDSVARLLDGYVNGWSAMYRDVCEATNVRGDQSTEVLDLRMTCLRERWNELRALSDVLIEGQAIAATNAIVAATALTPVERCADVSALRSGLAPPSDPATRKRVEALRDRLVAVKALQDAGRYGRALGEAVEIVSAARGVGYRPLVAEALNRLGLLQLDTSRPEEADASFEEALWMAEASSHDELVTEIATTEIYVAGYVERDMPKARRWIKQAQVFLERIGGHDLLRAWMLNNMGVALDANGDREGAVVELFKALHIKEQVLGKNHPDVSYTLVNLADTLGALGRSREALELSNRGVEIIGRTFGWRHPRLEPQLSNRAEILIQLGRYEEARKDAERAVAIHESEISPEANLVYALAPLGEAELGLGQPARAVAPLSRALKLAEESHVEAELPRVRLALARALWESGRDRRRARSLAAAVTGPAPARAPAASRAGQEGASTATARSDQVAQQAATWLASHREP